MVIITSNKITTMKKMTLLTLLFLCTLFVHAQIDEAQMKANMKDAERYLKGNGGKPKDKSKALQLYKQCAEAGNAKAMNAVGMQYRLGLGTAIDNDEAINWFTKAANAGYAGAWYNIGLIYKFGSGRPIDYQKAYENFSNAAEKDLPQGWYSKGYMLYKGLGCQQNYTDAVSLFKKGAYGGFSNSMYFLGLSYRNGYGIIANLDSASYWLSKAKERGYNAAAEELETKEPENADIAGSLVDKIKAAEEISKKPLTANTYTKIEEKITLENSDGIYVGYILKYDWSGKHIVKVDKLQIKLNYQADSLKGSWIENDNTNLPLSAILKDGNIVFNKMQYRKTDHYNQTKAELLVFERAQLQLTSTSEGIYLAGNVIMQSPERYEPAKPMYVVLKNAKAITSKLSEKEIDEKPLVVYPNPFTNFITVDFELKEDCIVITDILTIDGKIVYHNQAGKLQKGHYNLKVEPKQLATGTYFLKLQYGNKTKSTKVIKL